METPNWSTMKFRVRNFILMDGLSIFLERSRREKIGVAVRSRISTMLFAVFCEYRERSWKSLDANSFGYILACKFGAPNVSLSIADDHLHLRVALIPHSLSASE
jgi:hypothetical protein